MIKYLSQDKCHLLADTLPDMPETVMAISQLRRGLAKAWIVGEADRFETAVIENKNQPGEPIAFGHNPGQIGEVLSQVSGWSCVNVSPAMATPLAPLLEAEMGCPVRLWGDVYHTLAAPVTHFPHAQVRLLTTADWSLLASAPIELQGPNPRQALFETQAAGGFVDGRLIAIAQMVAASSTYGEIGVHTMPEYRNQGLSTAAASLIAQYIQDQGLIPIWSCGEGNDASLRVAQKLGFTEVSRRVYIILNR